MNPLELPLLSTAHRHEVARLVGEVYSLAPLQLIENAGRALAALTRRLLDDDLADRPLVVLAGRGHKGSAGLVAARYLINAGAWVQVLLVHPHAAYTNLAARQLATLHAMDAAVAWAEEGWELPPADLVVDALIGSGLRGDPHGKARDLIQLANSSVAPILSLDAPSGLDLDSGRLHTPSIRATATLLVTLPSVSLASATGLSACGDLYLADAGIPMHLYERLGLDVPVLFGRDPIIPLYVLNGKVMAG